MNRMKKAWCVVRWGREMGAGPTADGGAGPDSEPGQGGEVDWARKDVLGLDGRLDGGLVFLKIERNVKSEDHAFWKRPLFR